MTAERPADWDDLDEWPFDWSRRMKLTIHGDPNPIVRALGLDIELPDPDRRDAAYWERVHAEGWKSKLRGKIADTWEKGDPDWALLLKPEWGRIWFDLEVGIVIYFSIDNLAHAVALLGKLSADGISFVADNGWSLVWLMPCLLDQLAEFAPTVEAAGFVPHPHRGIGWTLPSTMEPR
jgi:hypothetical protein